MADGKNLLLIVNPRAGQMQSQRGFYKIVEIFCGQGYNVSVHLTQCQGDATHAAQTKGPSHHIVVCAGGDGTLNATVEGLMRLNPRPRLGYIPCGSTNDFAASLKLSAKMHTAAKNIAAGGVYPIDVGCFNGRHFCYIASFGAFSESSYLADQKVKNVVGHLAYIFEGIKDVRNIRPYALRVTADGVQCEGDYIFGGVCNTLSMGGLLKLPADTVDLSDGLFEVLLIRHPKSAGELQKIISCLTRQQFDGEQVSMLKAQTVDFAFNEDVAWSLDGEYADGGAAAHIVNLRHAVELII